VDKPPLYLYTLAGTMSVLGTGEVAARVPNLFASVLGIALVYRLGARLYGRRTGTWAALFLALSPFDILFARTAFTDPMLVLWVMGALCVVVDVRRAGFRRWFWTGVLVGLAFATKQHAVVLAPVVVAMGALRGLQVRQGLRAALPAGAASLPRQGALRRSLRPLLGALLGFAILYGLVVLWDSARWAVRPGYWRQSAQSYGGLIWAAPADWAERLVEWLSWARYLLGSPLLNVVLLVGGVVLLVWGWRRRGRVDREEARRLWVDRLLALYVLAYLAFHTVVRFSVWDRYLLPLVPLLALLMARTLVKEGRWLSVWGAHRSGGRWPTVLRLGSALVVCLAALLAGGNGAFNGYPVGGEHWAYQGLDRVALYLKEHAPTDAVLYHHWLRWHYTYYLHDAGFELRWWESGAHLQREVLRTPERAQYIVLPDWRTIEPDAPALQFAPVYETRRRDGSVSLRLYIVEPSAP
jgi:4-amino-4-deoxy-L-arabinose transferase-like glycosyltransferase